MRILSGVMFLISEIITFEQTNTKVAAIPMPMALFTEVDVARVGHMPKTITKIGFSLMRPLVSSLIKLTVPAPFPALRARLTGWL